MSRAAGDQRGQATVELLGALLPLLLLGLVLLQLLAVGYASVLAGGAAEAGALSLASGRDGPAAARAALPEALRGRAKIAVSGGRVHVSVRPPTPLDTLAGRLEVAAWATVRRR
jgi:hypothetical protein